MAKDNRKHTRISFYLPVEIEGYNGPHWISELSMGGLFVDSESAGQFKTGEEIMELLHQLHSRGRTIVMVTHDAHMAAYAKRIIRFLDGAIESEEQNGGMV